MRGLSESLGPTPNVGYEPELRALPGAQADSALGSRVSTVADAREDSSFLRFGKLAATSSRRMTF